jgi:adenylosuccinate synthase
MPSGAIHNKKCLIANGVVLDPRVLINEIENLEKKDMQVDLAIDPLTSIILPYHNLLDGISEASLKHNKIGTTGRGIGPAYEDKYGRKGIRFIDLFDHVVFRRKLHENFELKKTIIERVYNQKFELDEEKIFEEYTLLAKRLKKYLLDVSKAVYEGIASKKIIFESAQGTFLDITYGTYPYVTASHPITGNVFVDVGFSPRELEVVGIVKAYTTRVGSGPFLTELNDETGEKIRHKGNEFGTTTGRPRRCGWLDLVMLKYSHRLNGFTSLAITKLDVLSGLEKIKVAVKYMMDGKEVDYPLTLEQMEKCDIGYEEFEGFKIKGNEKKYEDLDRNARKYLEFVEKFTGVPISVVSIGPDRGQTIMKDIIKW